MRDLPEAVELALHLVDNAAARRGIVAREEVGVALRIVLRFAAEHGFIHARPRRRDPVHRLPAQRVVSVSGAGLGGYRKRAAPPFQFSFDYPSSIRAARFP